MKLHDMAGASATSAALFPMLIKVWAGHDRHDLRYIRTSLTSLRRSALPDEVRVFIVDDASPDPALRPFLDEVFGSCANAEIWRNEERLGPNRGQEVVVPQLWARFPHAPYLICCDDDIIYTPGWLQSLIATYEAASAEGLSGIFAALNIPAKPHFEERTLSTGKVLLKERQMALNWLVPRRVYDRVGPFRAVGPAFDTDYQDRMRELRIPVVCMKPSLVQNIGYQGQYQTDESMRALDFVGRRATWLVVRDFAYSVRRLVIDTGEKIPEGRVKELLKTVMKPIRRLLSI